MGNGSSVTPTVNTSSIIPRVVIEHKISSGLFSVRSVMVSRRTTFVVRWWLTVLDVVGIRRSLHGPRHRLPSTGTSLKVHLSKDWRDVRVIGPVRGISSGSQPAGPVATGADETDGDRQGASDTRAFCPSLPQSQETPRGSPRVPKSDLRIV